MLYQLENLSLDPGLSTHIIEVVQEAIEFTGPGEPGAEKKPGLAPMGQTYAVPVEPGPALLTDHAPGFLSQALEEFLRLRARREVHL